jgi:hypothetical protein
VAGGAAGAPSSSIPLPAVAGTAHPKATAAGPDGAHRHLVTGQGAGLVRADHGGAPEGLHGGQGADDGAPPGHAPDADREGDGEHHRQPSGIADTARATAARKISCADMPRPARPGPPAPTGRRSPGPTFRPKSREARVRAGWPPPPAAGPSGRCVPPRSRCRCAPRSPGPGRASPRCRRRPCSPGLPGPAAPLQRLRPLRTARDSPVRADSSTSRPLTLTRRRSAGTRAPEVRSTRSPGTSSRLGTCGSPLPQHLRPRRREGGQGQHLLLRPEPPGRSRSAR